MPLVMTFNLNALRRELQHTAFPEYVLLHFIFAIFLVAITLYSSLATAEKSAKLRAEGRQGVAFAEREDVLRLADDIAQRRALDPAWTRRILGDAKLLGVVAKLMQPAPTGAVKNWTLYRSRFIDPIRIGVKFWKANRAALKRAENEFGDPAEIIVGIIGVETIYGQQMGDFRVIDALMTLALHFPQSHPRAAECTTYFRGELELFLSLCTTRPAPIRCSRSAVLRAPWACRNSCQVAGCAMRWITTAMGAPTSRKASPMQSARLPTTSRAKAGNLASRRTTKWDLMRRSWTWTRCSRPTPSRHLARQALQPKVRF